MQTRKIYFLNMLRQFFRFVVPAALRSKILLVYWEWLFNKSIKKFMSLKDFNKADTNLLKCIIIGWGNQGFSSMLGYTKEYIRQATKNSGPVLDCGSGLSTIILGIIGDRQGFEVISLEENDFWADKVKKYINRLGIKSVYIEIKKGHFNQDYFWYNPSDFVKSKQYSLILLDGPCDHNSNARYGLFPIMQHSMPNGCIVLADDFHDNVYRASLLKASLDFQFEINSVDCADSYSLIYMTK